MILTEKINIKMYARLLRDVSNTNNAIKIAEDLLYEVKFLEAKDFIIANTYRYEKKPGCVITINESYDDTSRIVLCAHELGHAVLGHKFKSNFHDSNFEKERDVNLFAVSLLFDDDDFNKPITEMTGYELQCIIDLNINNPYRK